MRVKGVIMSLALHYWMRSAHHCLGPPVSEMTYTVSSGTLNSTILYCTVVKKVWQHDHLLRYNTGIRQTETDRQTGTPLQYRTQYYWHQTGRDRQTDRNAITISWFALHALHVELLTASFESCKEFKMSQHCWSPEHANSTTSHQSCGICTGFRLTSG